VPLAGGRLFKVRKMAAHNGLAFGRAKGVGHIEAQRQASGVRKALREAGGEVPAEQMYGIVGLKRQAAARQAARDVRAEALKAGLSKKEARQKGDKELRRMAKAFEAEARKVRKVRELKAAVKGVAKGGPEGEATAGAKAKAGAKGREGLEGAPAVEAGAGVAAEAGEANKAEGGAKGGDKDKGTSELMGITGRARQAAARIAMRTARKAALGRGLPPKEAREEGLRELRRMAKAYAVEDAIKAREGGAKGGAVGEAGAKAEGGGGGRKRKGGREGEGAGKGGEGGKASKRQRGAPKGGPGAGQQGGGGGGKRPKAGGQPGQQAAASL
jgi:hypothetical protein